MGEDFGRSFLTIGSLIAELCNHRTICGVHVLPLLTAADEMGSKLFKKFEVQGLGFTASGTGV